MCWCCYTMNSVSSNSTSDHQESVNMLEDVISICPRASRIPDTRCNIKETSKVSQALPPLVTAMGYFANIGKVIIPRVLQNRATIWYQPYLQHLVKEGLEETHCDVMQRDAQCHTITYHKSLCISSKQKTQSKIW